MSRVRPSPPHVLQSLNVNLKRLGFAPGQPREEWSAVLSLLQRGSHPHRPWGAHTLHFPVLGRQVWGAREWRSEP